MWRGIEPERFRWALAELQSGQKSELSVVESDTSDTAIWRSGVRPFTKPSEVCLVAWNQSDDPTFGVNRRFWGKLPF
jgi:hypothetical protein